MNEKSLARGDAFQVLFAHNDESDFITLKQSVESSLEKELSYFAISLSEKTFINFDSYKRLIDEISSRTKSHHLSRPDLIITLLGLCEMKEFKEKKAIVINECLKLCDQYSEAASKKVINGILDRYEVSNE